MVNGEWRMEFAGIRVESPCLALPCTALLCSALLCSRIALAGRFTIHDSPFTLSRLLAESEVFNS
jgi:hypothetical protein